MQKFQIGCFVNGNPLPNYTPLMDDFNFDEPDEDGCTTLLLSWVIEIERLNKLFPNLHYFIKHQINDHQRI